ncbi:hypothetical protein ONS96_004853 [Cadophora gregata f. sp. sojae]|nr:hypothetical protein ONS96_004853 [Cadophora gregata f. sp. sojae]
MFSVSGYARDLDDLPTVLRDVLLPGFRSPVGRSRPRDQPRGDRRDRDHYDGDYYEGYFYDEDHQEREFYEGDYCDRNRPELQSKRVTWAEAESFVASKLSNGYHEKTLERMIKEEVDASGENGDYDPLFLEYCLHILRNMMHTSQFSQFKGNSYVQGAMERNPYDDGNNNGKGFTAVQVVSGYEKEKKNAKESEQCQFLDDKTAKRLRHMRERLHTEAERTWHENAAKEYHKDNQYDDRSNKRIFPRAPPSSPKVQRTRRVEFPYEPTMTESSTPGLQRDSRRYNTSVRDQERGRGKTKSHPAAHLHSSNRYTSRERSSSIRPGDSVSQYDSDFTTNVGADFSRLRLGSPPNTSNQSNADFSDDGSFSFIFESTERPHHAPLRGNTRHSWTSDVFQKLLTGKDHPYASGGRQDANIAPGVQSGSYSGLQDHVYDKGPAPRYRSEFRKRHESRHPPPPKPSRSSSRVDARETRTREASEISSSRTSSLNTFVHSHQGQITSHKRSGNPDDEKTVRFMVVVIPNLVLWALITCHHVRTVERDQKSVVL